MDDKEKLRVLLPHWITHNREHGSEFASWAEKIRSAGGPESEKIVAELTRAVSACAEVTDALEKAMAIAGGPVKSPHEHHSHHGHHHHG